MSNMEKDSEEYTEDYTNSEASYSESTRETETNTELGSDQGEVEKEVENDSVSTKDEKKTSFFKELIIYICIFMVLWKVVPAYVMQKTIVDGTSMLNTLHDEEQLLVEKLTYHFTDPNRFDIVILTPYGKDVDEHLVKRVIGLPGETIQIKEGGIFINGEKLEESYGREPIADGGIASQPLTLAEDEYFVMGDNRNGSSDSREDYIGPIKRDLIEGKAILRIWPLNRFGLLD
ncbi:signal peptidase I [Anaerosporobacter faecicola]|uniref:signal peptidase I n=1 Tax=Anaerosporobacter faecicola TaxID=2718714 RepID=UPI001EE5BAA9|nr:signal peptidase I [Anaerosporobacter faecicola]